MDLTSHPEMKRKAWAGTSEKDEGELAVAVSGGWVRLIEGDAGVEFAPINIQIDYNLQLGAEVTEGLVFRRQEDGEIPHMYLSPTSHDAARIWTPCVDSLWDRCTWELEITVPTYLDGGGEEPVVVVGTGELMEQITHPHSANKTIFYFLHANPTSVQHVLFAAGPFQVVTIGHYENKVILGFYLTGDEDDVRHSTSFMTRAMSFFSTEFGSYPYQDYKMVFVPEPRATCSIGATLALCSSELLHRADVLDQAFETRQILTLAFSQQWIGVNIIPRSLSDTWLINGLAIYLQALFLRQILGNNEHRFRLKRDMDKCARLDQGDQWPLCVPGTHLIDLSFINLKAPLVLHILDRHLAKAGTSLGLSRVIPRILLSALSDELPGNMLSTAWFFKTCRKISGLDLQAFQDQWVYGSGCPHLKVQTNFVRKKFVVELGIQQYQPAAKSAKRPTGFFEGSLTIRIHEADGAPFEHLVDVKQPFKLFNLPFNTKYKRTRRSGRIAARFSRFQDEFAGDENDDGLLDIDRSEVFAYPPWDDEHERSRWRVADWSEDQAETMLGEGGGYEWIRVDPECEWIAIFEFVERPWYWISQLQGDRDVVAQIEAIHNLTLNLSPVVASEFARTVLVENYYYRVRIEAVKALVLCNTPECDFLGSFLLFKLFDELFGTSQRRIDSFSNLAQHYVLRSLLSAMADLKTHETRQPLPAARQLLLEVLETHDNTSNPWDDSHYVATVIAALGNLLTPTPDVPVLDAIDRAITMDRLLPSYRNVVTAAALEAQMKSILCGQRTNDPSVFLAYTREGNLRSLRCIALDCLMLCKPAGRSIALIRYLLEIVNQDRSLIVRRHVAMSLSESILFSLAVGDVYLPSNNDIVDNMETEQARKQRAESRNKTIVKSLRRDFEDKSDFLRLLGQTLMNHFTVVDDEVRFALLKVAEITISSTSEPVPGVVITLPTPTVDGPPAPTIRLNASNNNKEDTAAPVRLVLNPKKAKLLPSQKAGLSDTDLKAIQNAWEKMSTHPSTLVFRQPVDPIRDGAPDYLSVITHPMDLSTAKAKLDNGMYSDRQQFARDMRLIAANCLKYNLPGTPVHKIGRTFERYFENLWSKTEATLSSAESLIDATLEPVQPRSVPETVASSSDPPSEVKVPAKVKIKPTRPIIDVSALPPMAPPPVPVRKSGSGSVSASKDKKRPHLSGDLDDLLGAEVDAIQDKPLKTEAAVPPKKSRLSPEKRDSLGPIKTPLAKVQPVIKLSTKPEPRPPVATADAREMPSMMLPAVPFKQKRCKHLLAVLIKEPAAAIFLRPVDPVADGCPTYLDEIKEPMDLGTISKRVDSRKYKFMGEVARDIELVFANCRQFNPPGEITRLADMTEAVYLREWARAISPKMYPDEKKAMSSLLARAIKDDLSAFFRVAVDPEALGIPQYFEIIPKEDARDLSLIRSKLEKGKYVSARQVDEDVDLMLENARVFNGEGPVVEAANAFGRWWTSQRSKMD